jgi:hypothetical protein
VSASAAARLSEPPAAPGGVPARALDGLRRRLDGDFRIDPWGLDPELVGLVALVARLRWHVDVVGAEHVPSEGPVLLVGNRRGGWTEPAVLLTGLASRLGRHVRPVGCPDVDPLGGALRRLGALPARREDVAGALRAGEVLAVPATRELVRFRAGHLPIDLLEPAVQQGAAVLPVAVTGWEVGRRWTVRIGAPVARPRSTGPRAVGRVAVDVATGLSALLDQSARQTSWGRARQVVDVVAGRARGTGEG